MEMMSSIKPTTLRSCADMPKSSYSSVSYFASSIGSFPFRTWKSTMRLLMGNKSSILVNPVTLSLLYKTTLLSASKQPKSVKWVTSFVRPIVSVWSGISITSRSTRDVRLNSHSPLVSFRLTLMHTLTSSSYDVQLFLSTSNRPARRVHWYWFIPWWWFYLLTSGISGIVSEEPSIKKLMSIFRSSEYSNIGP